MRNLNLLHSSVIGDSPELAGVNFLSVDYDTKDVYCASANALYVIHPGTQEVDFGVSLEDYISKDGSVKVIGLQHLPDQMSVCVALSSGDILLWNVTTRECECVGCVESGLLSMGWSPDHEVVVIITGMNTLIIMTRDFDAVTEVPIQQSGFGEAEFVTVGWGKKETQFHGSVGKQAAVQKVELVKPVFDWDDRCPRISWRGDGQYFVVSFISNDTGARVLRTWTREGALHATSESVDGIEQALSWRPSGSLIATSQRKPNRHDIIFFERNGLRHREFALPFGPSEIVVKEIMWNMESTVLLVWCEEKQQEEKNYDNTWHPKSWLQLWTMGNYHWYLKQSLEFPATAQDCVSAVTWDPEHAYVLHIICGNGQYLQYRWFWTTNCDGTEKAQVAVIDGDKLLMTPFSSTVVPPPMSAYSINLPSPVQNVFYSGNNIFVVLNDDSILSYSFTSDPSSSDDKTVQVQACGGTGFTSKCWSPVLCKKMRWQADELSTFPLKFYHFTSIDENLFLCSSLTLMGGNSLIHLCNTKNSQESGELTIEKSVEVEKKIIVIARNLETGSIVLQSIDGGLHSLDIEKMTVSSWKDHLGEVCQFSQPCPQMTVCTIGGEEVVIGLTERFRLFINNTQVATNCTSFALHNEFLLLTTHAHTCRCICRKTKLSAIESLSDGKVHPFDESVRRVERGSRIVCVVPNETKLVLQMPRGNLETIHPRALVLATVKNMLSKLQFATAFILMRKHRINMNLLYDHDPDLFLNNVQPFISQIDNATHINLFISELQEEDVTKTMYTATYQRDKDEVSCTSVKTAASKINKVCDAMKVALIEADHEKFLHCVLTAYVKKTTPELDTALHCIKNLKESTNNGHARAEEALKYLLFLVDVNELYDVALGTYDFDLVIMVAEKSQKDPKEYLPFLNNLRRLEPNYQKYTIDKHLKKFRSALQNIVSCGKDHFEECVNLVKEQRLFPEALELYTHDSDEYRAIATAYGDYLSDKKYHDEAGLVYLKGKKLELAYEQYDKCLEWRQCLCIAAQLGHNSEKIGEISRTFAPRLKECRKYNEAAILLEQYAEDPEEAIVTLIQGHYWDEALRIMYKYRREDFIETDLKPGLQEAFEQQLTLLQEQGALFEKRHMRLAVVRLEKEKKRLELIEGGGDHNRADSDLFSDTSSATGDSIMSDDVKSRGGQSRKSGSIYTKVSGSSRKAKRKAGNKKRWTLKEGSKNEDYAIVESLAQITKHIDSIRSEIGSLTRSLVQFHFEKQARKIQVEYEVFLTIIGNSLSDIWDPLQQEATSVQPSFGPDSTANTIALAMQQGVRISSPEEQLDPVLSVPPTLTKDNSWKLNILARTSDTLIL